MTVLAEASFIHLLLSILLFFLVNWIGKNSYSVGYVEVSLFMKSEEALAFNFLLRVLTPIVFIIIASALLYSLSLDKYVDNIYMVSVCYVGMRLIFILVTDRTRLINWWKQGVYSVSILVSSYYMYENLIKSKEKILPDFNSLANEIWIIILIFLFQIVNKLQPSEVGQFKRKNSYIKYKYELFKVKYGSFINRNATDLLVEKVAYAIMIYENFNRPKIVRVIEKINHRIRNRPHTLGVMQVRTDKIITDVESVKIGIEKLNRSYEPFLNERKDEISESDFSAMYEMISNYNGGDSYYQSVKDLVDILDSLYYSSVKER